VVGATPLARNASASALGDRRQKPQQATAVRTDKVAKSKRASNFSTRRCGSVRVIQVCLGGIRWAYFALQQHDQAIEWAPGHPD
jgi:hypothetical protein